MPRRPRQGGKEVLLELIEDDQQVAVDLRRARLQPVGERARPTAASADSRARWSRSRAASGSSRQARNSTIANCGCRLGGCLARLPAQVVGDAGVEHRALADAARAVEAASGAAAIRLAVDDLALGLAPEEERGLLLGEGHQPRVGAVTHGRRPPASGSSAQSRVCSRCDVALEIDVEDVDVAALPELLIELGRLPLDRPRLVGQLLLAGNAVQDDAHVPVAQAIAEEQEVALPQLRGQRHRHQVGQLGPRQVVDVVVFGDDVAVAIAVGQIAR